MKNLNHYILTLFLLVPIFCNGQEMVYKYNKIYYDGKIYEKDQVNSIMMTSIEANRLYRESLTSKSKMRSYALAGSLSTVLTTVFVLDFKNTIEESIVSAILLTPTYYALIAIAGGASITLYTATLYHHQKSNTSLKNAVNHYNWEVNELKKQDLSYFKLGMTNNGVGLSYVF